MLPRQTKRMEYCLGGAGWVDMVAVRYRADVGRVEIVARMGGVRSESAVRCKPPGIQIPVRGGLVVRVCFSAARVLFLRR